MNELINTIKSDLKSAMKERNDAVMSSLRLLLTAIQHKEISLRQGEKKELSDELILEVIAGEIKKRKDSLESFLAGNRDDLAEKERRAMEVVSRYLPKQLSEDEITVIVKEILSEEPGASAKDFGRIMGRLMPRVKGKADGTAVSSVLKRLLSE